MATLIDTESGVEVLSPGPARAYFHLMDTNPNPNYGVIHADADPTLPDDQLIEQAYNSDAASQIVINARIEGKQATVVIRGEDGVWRTLSRETPADWIRSHKLELVGPQAI